MVVTSVCVGMSVAVLVLCMKRGMDAVVSVAESVRRVGDALVDDRADRRLGQQGDRRWDLIKRSSAEKLHSYPTSLERRVAIVERDLDQNPMAELPHQACHAKQFGIVERVVRWRGDQEVGTL